MFAHGIDIDWDLVVLDEAHRLRNVYKTSNVIAKTLKEALERVHSKVLLTATPLQNSLLELYGLVSMIDDRVFGDIDSFRAQFTSQGRNQAFGSLRERLAPICKRTLRKQVQPYVSYTARKAIVEEFTPSTEEQELSRLVADYLRRPNLKALPEGQRQLISLVLWKLLASSTHAIAGALETMAKRLQGVLDEASEVAARPISPQRTRSRKLMCGYSVRLFRRREGRFSGCCKLMRAHADE